MKRILGTEETEAILRSVGLRATTQRVVFLKTLAGSLGPLSIEDLTRNAQGTFDLATGYRIIEVLVLAGIARRIELAQGRALYEIMGEHHHHAVCTVCGCIKDINACLPKGIDARVRNASGFARIDDHQLEFFGVCKLCEKTP